MRESEMGDIVNVVCTDKGAVYVDGTRITNQATKWGIHRHIEDFDCARSDVVRECLARGRNRHVSNIDDPVFLVQKATP